MSILHNLLEEQESSHTAKISSFIDKDIDWENTDNIIKINLYRIIQEGLQNINKYAKAKNVTLRIAKNEETISLTIEDDGVGFDVSKKSKGIGMQNMLSRTQDCNGVIEVHSSKGGGTKILITVPIKSNKLKVN